MSQLSGAVQLKTNITAKPRPLAVLTFFKTARKEHIPRNYANNDYDAASKGPVSVSECIVQGGVDYDKDPAEAAPNPTQQQNHNSRP